jgi:hypothetical protein
MRLLAFVSLAACGHGFFDPQPPRDAPVDSAGPPVMYIQSNLATTAGVQASVLTSTFPLALQAGDTIVAFVSWDSSLQQLTSVFDAAGSSFTVAIGPNVSSGWAQSAFVATLEQDRAFGAENVQASFTGNTKIRIQIAAYRNVGSPLVDVAIPGFGNSSEPAATAAVATTNAHDLLVVAGSSDGPLAGRVDGYSVRTQDTNDIVQDKEVFSAASYQPMANPGPNGNWVMQLVALRGL